jgi:hypothetical protein
MSAAPPAAFRPPALDATPLAGRPALLAPGAWLESRVACPPPLLTRLRTILGGIGTESSPVLRPDVRRPGLYDLCLDGWAICVLVYPGGRGARVLAAVPLGGRRGD